MSFPQKKLDTPYSAIVWWYIIISKVRKFRDLGPGLQSFLKVKVAVTLRCEIFDHEIDSLSPPTTIANTIIPIPMRFVSYFIIQSIRALEEHNKQTASVLIPKHCA